MKNEGAGNVAYTVRKMSFLGSEPGFGSRWPGSRTIVAAFCRSRHSEEQMHSFMRLVILG